MSVNCLVRYGPNFETESESRKVIKMSVLREGITAGLTADIIEKLKVNGITRVTDLISKELEEICQLASISYKVIYRGNGFSRI